MVLSFTLAISFANRFLSFFVNRRLFAISIVAISRQYKAECAVGVRLNGGGGAKGNEGFFLLRRHGRARRGSPDTVDKLIQCRLAWLHGTTSCVTGAARFPDFRMAFPFCLFNHNNNSYCRGRRLFIFYFFVWLSFVSSCRCFSLLKNIIIIITHNK